MIQDIPWQLLEKHFAQETSDEENKQVKDWIAKAPENVVIFEQLLAHYKQTGSLPIEFIPNTQLALSQINRKVTFGKRKIIKLHTRNF